VGSVDTKHNRIVCCKSCMIPLVNVYMPCESDEVAHDDFLPRNTPQSAVMSSL